MLLKTEKHAHLVGLESSWLNIGTDIIVDYATPPLKWMRKKLKRTNSKVYQFLAAEINQAEKINAFWINLFWLPGKKIMKLKFCSDTC